MYRVVCNRGHSPPSHTPHAPHRRPPRRRSDLRRIECELLATANELPDAALLFGRLAHHQGARNVRLIALDVAATIHQHHFAGSDFLWLARPVRVRARLAEQNQSELGSSTALRHRRRHDLADVIRRHASRNLRRGLAIGCDGDVTRRLHQRNLRRRLDHATRAHDAGVAARFNTERTQTFDGEETNRLLDADGTAPDPRALNQSATARRDFDARSRHGPPREPPGSRGSTVLRTLA